MRLFKFLEVQRFFCTGSLGPDDSWLRMEWGSLLEGPTKSRPPIKLVLVCKF